MSPICAEWSITWAAQFGCGGRGRLGLRHRHILGPGHVLPTGRNVNVLVLDTDVYSTRRAVIGVDTS